jgi:plastocyanin
LNGTTKLHDDCYPIIQNVQKTYWYTIFDYGEIDGFEADSNSIAKSNEMTPTTDTITPDNKAESNNQDAGNIGQEQGNEVTVTIVQGSADAGSGENKYNGSSHAGYGFDPPELTVKKGTIVRWINNDTSIHTVTSGKPSSGQVGLAFDSSYLNEGESYLHKFNSKKTYDYYCTMYSYMKGKIIVK